MGRPRYRFPVPRDALLVNSTADGRHARLDARPRALRNSTEGHRGGKAEAPFDSRASRPERWDDFLVPRDALLVNSTADGRHSRLDAPPRALRNPTEGHRGGKTEAYFDSRARRPERWDDPGIASRSRATPSW